MCPVRSVTYLSGRSEHPIAPGQQVGQQAERSASQLFDTSLSRSAAAEALGPERSVVPVAGVWQLRAAKHARPDRVDGLCALQPLPSSPIRMWISP